MNCAQCGAENREGARFCDSCGVPLAEPAREVRKTVTVLFCDVAGYTETGERLDPEALRKLQSRYFDDARAALERHGATVEKFIGDAVMAVFGIPQVHEDDALRAARAALEVRDAVSALGPQARIGINTGEVVAGTGDALVTGDAVNVAARLEQAAEPGVILIGDATHRLLSGAVTSELAGPVIAKGKTEPLAAWQLVDIQAGAEAVARHLDSPMVGRERERALLRHAFERSVDERACHLFTVLGPAGVGKSRLANELCKDVGTDARVLAGRCLPYGEGITFWPLYEILDELATRELLEAGASSPEELFFSVRKLLEEAARERPLVVLFDDVHWAAPTFLDFIDHVSDWSRDAPVLIVCLARPELLDERPAWGGGKLNATTVLLEPLPEDECELLISNLLGDAALAADARARILDAAEGNPLFVEEMLEMLIDDGLLERTNGSWVAAADLRGVAVPPTIQALLAARLDRLSTPERAVVERAAVEGRVFHRGAVAQLAPETMRAEVSAHLLALVRKELVRPDESDFADEDAFRFRHLLVRDAAYDSLPKEARAELHERFAIWLEAKVGGRRADYEEILGYHLEQAVRWRSELGAGDRGLARRAAAHLATAGLRARRRSDLPAATNLLERAASLLPAADPERTEFLPLLGSALTQTGEFVRAEAILTDAISEAKAAGDRRSEALALMYYNLLRGQTDPEWRLSDARQDAEAAVATFEELGDHLAAARAWQFVGQIAFFDGHCTEAVSAYEKCAEHTRLADEGRRDSSVPWWALAATLFGPLPVDEAESHCRELAELGQGDRYIEGFALAVRAVLAAMGGRLEEARSLRERGREIIEELGMRLNLAGVSMLFGYVDTLAGDEPAAEAEHRKGYDLSVEIGETGYLSTTACYLGDAVYGQGRYDEAFELSEEAEQTGALDDASTQIRWRALRAKVLARRGQFEQAETLARDAVDRTYRTDYIDDSAQIVGSLAEVLELAGDAAEARACFEEALELYERKGNVVSAARIRERLRALRAE
jgi:class 3 adenylate cyclase/tetratricopeptide (TPR) repeat protein